MTIDTQFNLFYKSLDRDPYKRGKQFEHFVKWFLKTDPEWATQVEQIWLWDEWSERWGADCGIDLVFRHKNGDLWAVQAKCYSPDHDITKHDVDKFLSESNRPNIKHRLLIATTDNMGANARQVCDGQEKSVVRFLLSDFEKSAVEYPANIAGLASAKRAPRPVPWSHQVEAVNAVTEAMKVEDRGQLIMACGTGKTYVTLWTMERLAAQRTLVLVPSLGLLSQFLREWTRATAVPFDVLCVCSDKTVSSSGEDQVVENIAELAFPVTSNAMEVRKFLLMTGNRVVFSTYQSSSVIVEAQSGQQIPSFDLIVADEAHRCSGRVDRDFTAVLDNALIRGNKRVFTTATPRTYSSVVKKAAEDRGVEVVGMDNIDLFGPVTFSLPFGEAIARNLLTDYQVVIVGVDDPTIAQYIANRELVRTDSGIETDSRSLASQIGLLKAIKDYNLRQTISFHNRIKGAEEFATGILNTVQWMAEDIRPSGTISANFVSSKMTASTRAGKMKRFKDLRKDERNLLTNSRCLSEGLDMPSLDGVAFIDPRRSQIDIIQAVGRAIRLSPNKKIGTIVLPVFIATGKNSQETIDASDFKPVWDVLNALKAHDDVLANEVDQFRTELGKTTDLRNFVQGLRKITIDLPTTVDERFGIALRTYLVEQITSSWNFWFGLLLTFVEQEGHANVPAEFKTIDGYRIGQWVHRQRNKRDLLQADRVERLESLSGWIWSTQEDTWERQFQSLQEFIAREHHAKVPIAYRTESSGSLATWMSNQRVLKDKLTPDRRMRLDAIPEWIWTLNDDRWEKQFSALKDFFELEGHLRVSKKFKTADGYLLCSWIQNQRTKSDQMSAERRLRLDSLPGWTWDPSMQLWEEGFNYLKEHTSKEGSANAPASCKAPDGFRIGGWISTQRATKDSMLSERKQRLESLAGWSWSERPEIKRQGWDEWFYHLQEFAAHEGHVRIPNGYVSLDGYEVGRWVTTQRGLKDDMSTERRSRLEALPGWAWDAVNAQWEEGFGHLVNFVNSENHARVPVNHVCDDGYKIGRWVGFQRAVQDRIPPVRKARLEAMPGWSWDAKSDNWEQGFNHLVEFAKQVGDTKVPNKFKSQSGFQLGEWVAGQRKIVANVAQERKARLEELPGWSWDILSDMWNKGFRHLTEFVDREGHAKVPSTYENLIGYKLGQWVSNQKTKQDNLSIEAKAQLEGLPGWRWSEKRAAKPQEWIESYKCLEEYVNQTGNVSGLKNYVSPDGFKLGAWATIQRMRKDVLPLEHQGLLESLAGWSWDIYADKWEAGFRSLKSFAEQMGHCNVPRQMKTVEGTQLGTWIVNQRQKRFDLAEDQKDRLEALPGWCWDVFAAQWEEGFRSLKTFVEREGHFRVPKSEKTIGGSLLLNSWLKNQRVKRNSMTIERKAMLEAIPCWCW